ncbi:MAG: DUF2004 domain-containing protein [Comamonas sp.]
MQHPYFGDLDTSDQDGTDVIWERDLELAGQPVDVALWANENQVLDPAQLDAFALLLEDLPELDAKARGFLTVELNEDDDFIAYHTDEVENFPALAAIAPDGEISIDEFVRALRLCNIGLWCDGTVVMDYQIDPDHSDQILAVKLDMQGGLKEVAWES